MSNAQDEQNDPNWNVAWQWVLREYDRENFDEVAQAELSAWLRADPSHCAAYESAARVWRLAALIPPVNSLGDEVDGQEFPEIS